MIEHDFLVTIYNETKHLKNYIKQYNRYINSVFYFGKYIPIYNIYDVKSRKDMDELNVITNIIDFDENLLNENDLINFYRNNITKNICDYICNCKEHISTKENIFSFVEELINRSNEKTQRKPNWLAGNSRTLNELSYKKLNIELFYLPLKDDCVISGCTSTTGENPISGICFYPLRNDLALLNNGSVKAITQYIIKPINIDYIDIIVSC